MRFALPAIALLALCACSDTDRTADPVAEGERQTGQVESSGGEVATFGNGVQLVESDASVEQSVERLEAALERNGFTVVAKLDHRENAAGVDLNLPPAVSVFFGKPEVGTFLMQASPEAALDLPQRMAIFEQGDKVMIAYNSPVWLASRHGIDGQDQRLDKITQALEMLAKSAAGEMTAPQQDEDAPVGDAPLMAQDEAQ